MLSGVGGHHHNAVAENAIKNIVNLKQKEDKLLIDYG